MIDASESFLKEIEALEALQGWRFKSTVLFVASLTGVSVILTLEAVRSSQQQIWQS